MTRQTGKGSRQRREAALERKATQHQDFIGQAEPQRAEAELRKHERMEAERNEEAVREMAEKLEEAAGLKGTDGTVGPEVPLRIPRSIDEGKKLIREAPDALREKARERLEKLPEPAKRAVSMAQDVAGLVFAPVRIGFHLAREVFRVPMAMIRVLRNREA